MTFYGILKSIHSLMAYVVLFSVLFATINATLGFFQKREYKKTDLKISLYGLIFTHLQILLGFILYFVSPLFNSWQALGGGVMKDAYLRKMLVEHPFGVILGVTLITIGWSLHKKQKTSQRTFGKIALFYGLGLVLILAVIPWKTWASF